MKYYTSGYNVHNQEQERTGAYNTMEEALIGLCHTSERFELAYLCNHETHHTIAYMYHGLTKQDKKYITLHFDRLRCLVE